MPTSVVCRTFTEVVSVSMAQEPFCFIARQTCSSSFSVVMDLNWYLTDARRDGGREDDSSGEVLGELFVLSGRSFKREEKRRRSNKGRALSNAFSCRLSS